MDDESKPAYNWKKDFKPFFIVFGAVIVVTFLFVMCNIPNTKSNSSVTPTTESLQSKKVKAFVYSQSAVEKNLKAPSTAKFPYITDSDVAVAQNKDNPDKFIIMAYVDSENSFGAMIRSNYSVTITFTGEDTYKWEDLYIGK